MKVLLFRGVKQSSRPHLNPPPKSFWALSWEIGLGRFPWEVAASFLRGDLSGAARSPSIGRGSSQGGGTDPPRTPSRRSQRLFRSQLSSSIATRLGRSVLWISRSCVSLWEEGTPLLGSRSPQRGGRKGSGDHVSYLVTTLLKY